MRPRPSLLLLLSLLLWSPFVAGLAPAPALAADDDAVCRPAPECRKACRMEARRALVDCRHGGGQGRACEERSRAQRTACVASRCAPDPTCEERCERQAAAGLHHCLVSGKALDGCRAQAESEQEACVASQCAPCVCPFVWAPVCGTDGNTYGNACEAGCAGVEIAYEGECSTCADLGLTAESCAVIRCAGDGGESVCGDDGTTYPNACVACCAAGVEIAHEGACEQPCACPKIYSPVCGVDGATYDNGCLAGCADVEIAYEGECRDPGPPCACPQVWAPVCGVDGHTYGNTCEANCAGVEIAHPGPCE